MSTTFEVLPSLNWIPKRSEVIELAQGQLHIFLQSIGINKKVQLKVERYKALTDIIISTAQSEPIVHNSGECDCFYFLNIPGSTGCYYYKYLPITYKVWEDEIRLNENVHKHRDVVKKNLAVGYSWIFRRTAGQPAIICLTYGLLAYTLAKLTDGLIYTEDGAWDYDKFPACPDDFIRWYYRPECATDKKDRESSQIGILSLKKEIESVKE